MRGDGDATIGDVPLIHTAQLLPGSREGVAAQLAQLCTRLEAILRDAGCDAKRLVKVNCYLASQAIAEETIEELTDRKFTAKFPDLKLSVMNFVVTALPNPNALIALDAVAATSGEALGDVKRLNGASILPAGSRLYVSGQAEKGDTLRQATRKTLESLSATLKHCGRTDNDVVQVKCFLQPMSSVAEVQDEIARYYGKESVPPTSFVEWKSSSPPIEIELVAWGGPANNDAKDVLEFITPPGMTTSPVFSRVARINRGPTIFIGDIASPATLSADEQLQSSFGRTRQTPHQNRQRLQASRQSHLLRHRR